MVIKCNLCMLKYMLILKLPFFFFVSTPSWGFSFSLFWFKMEFLRNHVTQLDDPHKAYCSKYMSVDVNVSYTVLSAGLSCCLYVAYFYGPEIHMLDHIAIFENIVAKTYPSYRKPWKNIDSVGNWEEGS